MRCFAADGDGDRPNVLQIVPLLPRGPGRPSLEAMQRAARKMLSERPFRFTNLRKAQGVEEIAAFIRQKGGL